MLFVGVDWTRKGGDIAIGALDRLRANGVDATLTVVGRIPQAARTHPGVINAGFLNKNHPRDRARLRYRRRRRTDRQHPGRVLPLAAPAADWAGAITDLTRDPTAYALVSDAAFDRAQGRFSWGAWAAEIDTIVRRTLGAAEIGATRKLQSPLKAVIR